MLEYNLDLRNNSYSYSPTLDDFAKSFPFYCTDSGKFFAGEKYMTRRDGFDSFLLIVTTDGAGKMIYGSQSCILEKGSAVLIDCNVYQEYSTCEGENWDFYFLHFNAACFDGYKNALLSSLTPITLKNPKAVEKLIEKIYRLSFKNDVLSYSSIANNISAILTEMLYSLADDDKSTVMLQRSDISLLAEYIRENCTKNLHLDNFTDKVNLSKHHLIRIFSRQMGMSPYKFMHMCRINRAQLLLRSTDMTVEQIAFEVGYNDSVVFIRHFKTFNNTTPAAYRKESIMIPFDNGLKEDIMNFNDFKTPNVKFYPRPLWFWNDVPTDEALALVTDNAREESCYGGFGILPYDACGLKYMSDEYLDAYEFVLKRAKEKGLKLCLYDEWWFPSGSAGGLLKEKYPEACARRLDKFEFSVSGECQIDLPDGKLMSVVAVNKDFSEIINLREFVEDKNLVWQSPEGEWTVMVFVCVLSDWDRVNYLDPDSVKKFIEVTHEAYFKRFSEYFGTVIDSSFYDEPQMYTLDGRMWTCDFNEKFEAKHGFSPETLYPALWYDIGENTASARYSLHTFRADLYANGFPKVIQEWCTAHRISLTGHVDQEEVVNPTGITGDLMKSFKYQDIPGYDEIFTPRRGSKMYKIVSSSAQNFDKPLVMTECYGAMPKELTIETMYDEAMEQFAKGMNLLVPHAVWTNPEKDIVTPELSYRNPHYHNKLKPFNEFCARMATMLQGGRHVADIAVLYPIEDLENAYYFEWDGHPYYGGPAPEHQNYQEIGSWLSENIRKDFTFLHPEVLDEKCSVKNGKIKLDNKINFEEYKVLIIPGVEVLSLTTLKKVLEFLESGGVVISAGRLPEFSAEQNKNGELKDIINRIFVPATDGYSLKEFEGGGKAYHIKDASIELLAEVLKASKVSFDVELSAKCESDGYISYLHKVLNDKDFYYVTNCNENEATISLSLISDKSYELWNPHDGTKSEIESRIADNRQHFEITLKPHSSVILITK